MVAGERISFTMITRSQPTRRAFLRGLGTLMALPTLESLTPRARAAVAADPTRMAFLYLPNGVNVHEWFPQGDGANAKFGSTLKALEAHRSELTVFRGLTHDKARSNGDGGGDHARSSAAFLTGIQPKKTAGADIELGISADQIAANKIGHLTKLASLELSADGQRSAGRCDSGYSCAYQFNLSWRNERTPMAPEMDPKAVFERLFGLGSADQSPESKRRRALEGSILDVIQEDARSIQKNATAADRAKLDEYFTAVRDIEVRIERATRMTKPLPPGVQAPTGVPDAYKDHIRMMFDLMTLAFQTDSTRIATFLLAHDGSNRSFGDIGVSEGHHQLSHHQNDADKLRRIALIDRFYVEQFAYFLDKLRNTKEQGKSLLDSSMIVWGSAIRDGNRHDHDDLPVILAGRGNGTLNPGRVMTTPGETPMTNLYLAMLERMSVKAERIGDSTGVLAGI
jgi:Protein of unknown function (DUF1552)